MRTWWLSLALLACKKEPEPQWVPFNADDDVVNVEVVDGDPGEAIYADLHSTTGTSLIGDVRVDPGSGPPGTEHEVRVSLSQEYEERVQRADLVVTAPNGGVFAYSMEQDSAEGWRWVLHITSTSAEDTPHTEDLAIDLYELVIPPVVEEEDNGISIFDF